MLAKLRRVRIVEEHVSLRHRRETERCLPPEESLVIADVDQEMRFRRSPFADVGRLINAAIGKPHPEVQQFLKEDARETLAERETRLIAEYDALFLASVRIQFTSRPQEGSHC
jgi:hypothetical protein